jgi:hypothetical protein
VAGIIPVIHVPIAAIGMHLPRTGGPLRQ